MAGLSVSVSALDFTNQGIVLQGSISLPTGSSGNAGPLSFGTSGPLSLSVLINSAGIALTGAQLQLPDVTIQYQGIGLQATGMTVGYLASDQTHQDRFTIQGTATLSSPFGTLTADFADPNVITVEGGLLSFVGTISIADVDFGYGWGLKKAFLTIDTTQHTLKAGADVYTPLGCDVSAELGFVNGELDSISMDVGSFNNGAGVPLEGSPLFLQSIHGALQSLSDPASLSFTGTLVLTTGPKFQIPLPSWLGGTVSGSVMEFDIKGQFTANQVTGSVTMTIAGGLGQGQGSFVLDETTWTVTESGSVTLLDGFVRTNASLTVDQQGDIDLTGSGTVSLPPITVLGFSLPNIPLTSAQVVFQYHSNADASNDFVQATGTLGNSTDVGFRVDFAGNFTPISVSMGADLLQATLGSDPTPTFDASDNSDFQTLLAAADGLTSPSSAATVTIDVSQGTFGDAVVSPPDGVVLQIVGSDQGTIVQGSSPALSQSSGSLLVRGVTFTTVTDSPTIMVTGGTLILRNDDIEESTGFAKLAIDITGGLLDLGTTASPGGNVVNVNGTGEFVDNSTSNLAPAIGDTFEVNGSPLVAYFPSVTALSSSTAFSVYGQVVTFTAAIKVASGTPTGSVQFQIDGVDNGPPVTLVNGSVTISTSNLSAGGHTITAFYASDTSEFGNSDSSWGRDHQTVTPAPLTVSADNKTMNYATIVPILSVTYLGLVNGDNSSAITGTPSLTTTATSSSPLGTYPISVAQGTLSAANYTFSLVPGTMTVTLGADSIYILDPTGKGALTLTDSGSINIPGSLVVDSSSNRAIMAKDHATVAAAGGVFVTGGISTSGHAQVQSPTGQPGTTLDPLAGLAAPSTAGLTNYIARGNGDCDDDSNKYGDHVTMTIGPGIYSRVRVLGNATLMLLPGIYYIAGGGLTVSGSASLVMAPSTTPGYQLDPVTGAGVLIYNTGSLTGHHKDYGSISLKGNGTVNLQAATSGPYAGILIFQDPNNGRSMNLNGHSSAGMTGIIYAPAALLDMDSHSSLACGLVVQSLNLSGNAGADVVGSSGRFGRDLLVGGQGMSPLNAGSGDDILIAGSTSFDAPTNFDNNLKALAAIMDEWRRTDETYTQRVGHIHGFTTGGLNGRYLLRSPTVQLAPGPDLLNGGNGMDWFWANLAVDTITNQKKGERVN
jgi:hypothetical protein